MKIDNPAIDVKGLETGVYFISIIDNSGETIDMVALAKEVQKEEKRTNDSIRKLTGEGEVENGVEEADLTTTFSDKDSF